MKTPFMKMGWCLGFTLWSALALGATHEKTSRTAIQQRSFDIPVLELAAPNMDYIRKEDEKRDRNGELYRIGVATYTDVTLSNRGSWTNQPDGSRTWQLRIHSPGAEALSFIFKQFDLAEGAVFRVTDLAGKDLHRPLRRSDMLEDLQQNVALCFGDDMLLSLYEPAESVGKSSLQMDRVIYNYRSTGNPAAPAKINESDNCEINVNCSPVGDAWQDEKRGVARIYIVDGNGAGWCTGSLVNNTAQNCKPLFLTALHCGVSTTASDSNLWRFYFRYEASGCTSPSTAGTLDDYYITGCVRLANSNDNGGDSGSDFLLVQLGTIANEATTISTLKSANFNAYWNGWDANNTTVSSCVGIHHPAGDIKKISTGGATTSSSWGGTVSNTHWRLTWVANSNGHGVTEGGSSGSPLFNSAGRQIGTLTGGGSYCTALTSPDSYGKVSYHWTSNGTASQNRLKTYLDPLNTGQLILDGSSNPCASSSNTVVANFTATPTSLTTGGTVQFSNSSTGSPTTYSWSISPATGWSFAGGTTAASANPQVTFTTAGSYSVTLVASNSTSSDNEVKTGYITVTTATTPTCSDTYESNNTLSTAKLMTVGTTIRPFIGTSTDVDYFKFSNTSVNKYIRVTLSNLPADYDLYLYNSSGTLLASSTNGSTTSDVIAYDPTTVGTFYVRVKGYNSAYSSTSCYALLAETRSTSYKSETFTLGNGGKLPEQLFAVAPNPVTDGRLTVQLTDEIDGELTLALRDAAGRVVSQQVITKGEGTESFAFDVEHLRAGMYFISIQGTTLLLTEKVLIENR